MYFYGKYYNYEFFETMRENQKMILEQIRENKRLNKLIEDKLDE